MDTVLPVNNSTTPTTISISSRNRRPPPSPPPPAATGTTSKFLTMARRRSFWRTTLLISLITVAALGALAPVFAPLPPFSSSLSSISDFRHFKKRSDGPRFEIAEDQFWKDGEPFRIIGGDLHYFRVLRENWEDRLLRAKALGLNTIQTYVAWNLHEPRQGEFDFDGIADVASFLKLCHKLDLLVMLRAGPYICGEWDLGGFPPWLLAKEPPIRLRSSDPAFLELVESWWNKLLAKVYPLLYSNGGPIIMVQIENEFGSYGDDKAYLHHLVKLARGHLGKDVILYTTDGGTTETLKKGTISGDVVFSAVDFTTGDDPGPIFELQKKFNEPGKSPPLSAEFYTGWLTHWAEKIASTSATFTANSLEKILSMNASVVLYMACGGTNFGFYNGANTGADELDYKPDLTSYDYDAPIRESGDVDNPKYKALKTVIARYSEPTTITVPLDNEKAAYGRIGLKKLASLFDVVENEESISVVESENPLSMESVGQMFGFLLYVSEFTSKGSGSMLSIPEVRDRAQVFVSCADDDNEKRRIYIGHIERWSNKPIHLPPTNCVSRTKIYILVENMGRVNYGQYLFDRKGILSSVYVGGRHLYKWKMFSVPFHNLNEDQKMISVLSDAFNFSKIVSRRSLTNESWNNSEPTLYRGRFTIGDVKDTYISFRGWSKGIAFVNGFNIGRYWPSVGPQCNLYVPAPVLRAGKNVLVLLELESANTELSVSSTDRPDFTCSSTVSKVN